MKLSLGISHKVMMLVALPMIFNLICFGVLNKMLEDAERDAVRADRAREIVSHLNKLLSKIMQAGAGVGVAAVSAGAPTQTEIDLNAWGAELPKLMTLVADRPEELQYMLRIQTKVQEGARALAQVKHMLREGAGLTALPYMTKMQPIIRKIVADAEILFDAEQKIDDSSPEIEAAHRTQIKLLIIIGVVANILFAVGAGIFFNQSTARRLGTLIENSTRFSARKPLLPALEGDDEIAQVDGAFRTMAETISEMDQVKQDFVAMVSHDLRTPLTSVRGTLTLVAEGVLDVASDRGQKRLLDAQTNIDRLIGLVNDLLDIEKMASGHLAITMESVDLMQAAEEAIESVRGYSDQQGVRLEEQLEPATVKGDRDRLIQVMINLLSNALKFSPAGSTVKLHLSAGKEQVEVHVSDSGRGIAPDQLQNIFERFKQVKRQDGKRGVGTGLGLTISKSIIEAHHGTIGVDSEDGKGSTFWFIIPN